MPRAGDPKRRQKLNHLVGSGGGVTQARAVGALTPIHKVTMVREGGRPPPDPEQDAHLAPPHADVKGKGPRLGWLGPRDVSQGKTKRLSIHCAHSSQGTFPSQNRA